ncbi:hypothetical protein EZS27_026586, partial [termite gut metagenome]
FRIRILVGFDGKGGNQTLNHLIITPFLSFSQLSATHPKRFPQASWRFLLRLGSGEVSDMNRRGIGHESDRTVKHMVFVWYSAR